MVVGVPVKIPSVRIPRLFASSNAHHCGDAIIEFIQITMMNKSMQIILRSFIYS
jgi:hypothetical protein